MNQNIYLVESENSLKATIALMDKAQRIAERDRNFIQWCFKTFQGSYENEKAFIYRVWNYAAKNFKFQDDEYDETIINPRILIQLKTGDCDDFSLFIKTVLAIFRINSTYVLLAKRPGEFSHIAVFVKGIYVDATSENFGHVPAQYKFIKFV